MLTTALDSVAARILASTDSMLITPMLDCIKTFWRSLRLRVLTLSYVLCSGKNCRRKSRTSESTSPVHGSQPPLHVDIESVELEHAMENHHLGLQGRWSCHDSTHVCGEMFFGGLRPRCEVFRETLRELVDNATLKYPPWWDVLRESR